MVIGRLDLKLSKKKAEQTLAWLTAPLDILCPPTSMGECFNDWVGLFWRGELCG